MVRYLLSHGASVDASDAMGETALIKASAVGHVDTVSLLLRAGADPNKSSRNGDTPLRTAARIGSGPTMALLFRGGAIPMVQIDEKSVPITMKHGLCESRTTVRNAHIHQLAIG